MKILLINKFLHPNGGSETYLFGLGEQLKKCGHEVQYFGMEHEGRIVGNNVNSYTSDMDFHGGSRLSKLTYPIKTIYSAEARKKLYAVLRDFEPDVCHLNNFNFQLTPSIILEIVKWREKNAKKCQIIYTAHDSQLVCPNHLMQNPNTSETCQKCFGGRFLNCVKGRCIHGSFAKSVIGAAEGYFWRLLNVYRYLDRVIAPSSFIAGCLATNPLLKDKITVMHNFIDITPPTVQKKEDYVLFYGRYSDEKGISTLLNAIDMLPEISFVFAGSGPLKEEIIKRKNVSDKGFLSGDELLNTVSKALFTVVPSECYENCPFSVMESLVCGTPVIGADIGGISELIDNGKNGELFESGNALALKSAIEGLFSNKEKLNLYTENAKNTSFEKAEDYFSRLVSLLQ